jgi:hypothetical protein
MTRAPEVTALAKVSTTPRLVELPYLVNRKIRVLLAVGLGGGVGLLVAAAVGLGSGPAAGIAMALLIIVVLALIAATLVTLDAGFRTAQRLIAADTEADGGRIVQATVRKVWYWHPLRVARQALSACALAGRIGPAVRLNRVNPPTAIEPIVVPFEALELDETDRRFNELRTMASPVDEKTLGPIRRNVLLKGGWLVVIAFGFNCVVQAIDAVLRWRITPMLVYWTAFFLITLLIPVGTRPWMTKQFLAVPGGLIYRRSSGFRRNWTLHLFGPADSLICVLPVRRNQWGIAVADANEAASAVCTKAEAELALQAWLSPLEPPRVEELTDLA